MARPAAGRHRSRPVGSAGRLRLGPGPAGLGVGVAAGAGHRDGRGSIGDQSLAPRGGRCGPAASFRSSPRRLMSVITRAGTGTGPERR